MGKQKPILLIDQDDVLAEYILEVTHRFNDKFGSSYHPNDCIRWDLVSIFGEGILDIMYSPEIFRELVPVKHAIETFKRLYDSNLFEMFIVTAAIPSAVPHKHEWIRQYMPFFPEKNVIICVEKQMIKGDFLLDDGLHNIEAFANGGGTSIIFDRPHNQLCKDAHKRVKGWLEFEAYIMDTCYPELVASYFNTKEYAVI